MTGKFLSALAAIALSASAVAAPGVYVQGDVGTAQVKAKFDEGSLSKSGFSPRLTVGYDFGNNWRAGVDYTHYKTIKHSESNGYYSEHYKTKFQSVGVSAIYDFPLNETVKPYLGARLGINHVSDKYEYSGSYSSTSESYSKTKTGVGALAGVGFNITDNVALDVGYRYNYWGKFDGAKLHSNEFSAGVRVKF
ncbi:opacity family porin [Neisseria dentiae]